MTIIVWNVYSDHARTVNLILLMLCIAALTVNMITRWRYMNRRTRRILCWVYAILLNVAYAFTFVIREHRSNNPSVPIASILFTGLLISLLWHPRGDEKRLLDDHSLGSRFLFWVDKRVRAFKRGERGIAVMITPGDGEELQPGEEEAELAVEGEDPDVQPTIPPEPGSTPDLGHGLPGVAEPMPEDDDLNEEGGGL